MPFVSQKDQLESMDSSCREQRQSTMLTICPSSWLLDATWAAHMVE